MKQRPTQQTPFDPEDLRQALDTLRQGGIILYPTDTIWGIGCDATNEAAVRRIYELKQRADNKSMLVLIGADHELERLVPEVPEVAYDMIELAVRPITIIYSGAHGVAPNLLGEGDSLGIRLTQEAFSAALCRGLGRPIVSTSANISGSPSAAYFSEVAPEIRQGVDYIVRYRQEDNTPHEPSQIIMLGPSGQVKVLRP